MSDQDLSFAVSWQESLKSLFRDFAPVSLTSIDGSAVHIESLEASDFTLSACARTCQQYLKMKPGDMAITNDPSSAASALNEICLVRAISLSAKSAKDASTDFLLALRFRIGGSPNLKSETNALRIPPTPIAVSDKINNEILTAIGQHPGAAFQFAERIAHEIERLRELERRLHRLKNLPGFSFTKDQLDLYFDSTKKSLLSWISKTLSNGEFHFQHKISTGDLIKLKIECRENENILFDFVGTGPSEKFHLTEFLSLSACFAALNSLSSLEIPANQGSFAAIQVRTPQNSMLNSKRIQNSFLTKNLHFIELCNFLRTSLLKLARASKNFAEDASALGPNSLEFSPSKIFDFTLLGGQGGSSEKAGAAAYNPWLSPVSFSVENTEKDFALQFLSISRRPVTLGKGLRSGGTGIQLSLVIKAPALFHSNADFGSRAQGQSQGKPGEKPEAFIENETNKTELTDAFEEKIEAGTVLRFLSGGGGGWGEEKLESEDD